MRVSIQLQLEAALQLQESGTKDRGAAPAQLGAAPVLKLLKKLGLRLEPVHPGTSDPMLAPYFAIEIADRQTADRVLQELQQMKVVDAAYLKPEDEMP